MVFSSLNIGTPSLTESAFPQRAPLSTDSKEAQFYYAGLPSSPVLVARSSTTPWEEPSGPEAYSRPKVLRAVGRHAIKDVWEGDLSHKVIKYLDSMKVPWTSIDVVRIGYVVESFHPVILWVGVPPESLSVEDGIKVACDCQDILIQSGIVDVDVEIRESIATFFGGPKLLAPAFLDRTGTVDVRNPLTPTLGLPISGKLTLWAGGTGGFFVAEGGDSKRLFLVTARHVLFKPNRNDNNTFEHKSPGAPRHEVVLLGDAAFKKFLKSIQDEIKKKGFMIQFLESRIAKIKEKPGYALENLKECGDDLAHAKEAMEDLSTFYADVPTCWASPDERVLGHVIYSPPIELGFGTEKYTQDFAVIDIDLSKIDATNFKGNVIDLGTKIKLDVFTCMMCPNLQNLHTFEYPVDRLMRLKGTIPDEDMRHPPTLDQNGDPYLMVVKHGNATDLTVGRANDVRSCVRNYYEDGTTNFSMEWAILPQDNKSGAFAAPGDSGAVVADGSGRIGGIITGGAGATASESSDITYVTGINSVMEGIKVKFPKAHLNPDLRA